MDTKELMSGIAVVIDDALAETSLVQGENARGDDLIAQIVRWFETQWHLPVYQDDHVTRSSIPAEPIPVG